MMNRNAEIVHLKPFPAKTKRDPIDFLALEHELAWCHPTLISGVFIEMQYAPRQREGRKQQAGGKATLVDYGRLLQVFASFYGEEPTQVPASTWQNKVLVGMEAIDIPFRDPSVSKPDKAPIKASKRRAYCKAVEMGWDIPWGSNRKDATPHDGLVDAACIALYGLSTLVEL